MDESSSQYELIVKQPEINNLQILRIPKSVHQIWACYDVGQIVAYSDDNYNFMTSVDGKQTFLKSKANSINDAVLCSTRIYDIHDGLDDLKYVGPIDKSIMYTRSVSDLMLKKSATNMSITHTNSSAQTIDPDNKHSQKHIFHFYDDPNLLAQKSSNNLNLVTNRLISLFQNANYELTSLDIRKNISLPNTVIKRVLSRIADARKSNKNRLIYTLKSHLRTN